MNISRTAFYQLVKMQNHLNDLSAEKSFLSDELQSHVDLHIDNLRSEIQVLTEKYLTEVEYNRSLAEEQSAEFQMFPWVFIP